MVTHPELHIDLNAIVANWRAFQHTAPKAAVAAVVKSDAYGLGAQNISLALYNAGCRVFFTASIAESTDLSKTLPKNVQLCSFGGIFSQEMLYYQNDTRLIPVLNSLEQVQIWRSNPALHPRGAYVHVDTGMNRLGIHYADWNALCPLLDFPVHSLLSHLATADEQDSSFAKQQCQRFFALEGFAHSLANSAGAFLGSAFHGDLLRPGIGLYGINPIPHRTDISVQSALSLNVPILQIRHVSPAETIGYGQHYCAKKPMRIATVGIGYNEGLPRILTNHPEFCGWYQGAKLPILGRISMDSLALDLTDAAEISETSQISFLNSIQGVDDLAKACNTVPHEALTRLGGRIQKIINDR